MSQILFKFKITWLAKRFRKQQNNLNQNIKSSYSTSTLYWLVLTVKDIKTGVLKQC